MKEWLTRLYFCLASTSDNSVEGDSNNIRGDSNRNSTCYRNSLGF